MATLRDLENLLERMGCMLENDEDPRTYVCYWGGERGDVDIWWGEDITITGYNADEEIDTPEVIAQHGYDLDPSDVLSKEEIRRIEREARREWEREKNRGGWLNWEDYLNYRLDEAVTEALETMAAREIEEWEKLKPETRRFGRVTVTRRPTIIEKECFVNIPHEHYYKGYTCDLKKEDLEKLSEKTLEEVITWCMGG